MELQQETSDKDYKGICIPPKEYYLGLETFNEYNNTGGKNFKNTKDDVDVSIMHVSKFVKDAMSGVPNNIELLFIDKGEYLKITDEAKKLIDNRHLFLTKKIKSKFGGYANSQMKKMENKKVDNKFGYDTKLYMHTIRLLTSAIEILETGDFSTKRSNRDHLLDIRKGIHSFDEALMEIKTYDQILKTAFENSKIPEKPDYDKVNELLMEINMSCFNEKINR